MNYPFDHRVGQRLDGRPPIPAPPVRPRAKRSYRSDAAAGWVVEVRGAGGDWYVTGVYDSETEAAQAMAEVRL